MSGGAVQAAVVQGFPLSPQQRHLWALRAAVPGSACRAEGVIAIEGPLDVRLLRAALSRVVERHEILRTTFRCLPGMTVPLQVVGEAGLSWRGERDFSALDATRRTAAVEEAFEELGRPPAGDADRPLAALLAATGPDRHLLLVRLPALAADAGTLDNLVGEIGSAYAAAAGAGELATELLQYADFAAWQNELLDSAETEAAREHWRRLVPAALVEARLPFERREEGAGFAPRAVAVDLAVPAGAPPAAFLLACWQALLVRLAGTPDLMVAGLCDGRDFEELAGALGPFAKHLPIACRIEEGERFAQVVRRAARALDQARASQAAFSWERFAGRDTTGGPAAAADAPSGLAFAFESAGPPASWSGAGLRFALVRRRVWAERFALKLACGPALAGKAAAEVEFDAVRFDAADVQRLAGWLAELARDAAHRPEAIVGELALLTPAESVELLAERERARVELPVRCLHALMTEQAARTPERVAVRGEEGTLTYAALAARAGGLARRLAALGVGPEQPVAIHAERSPDMVVGLLAVLAAGGAWVPLDPDLPSERLAGILGEVRPRVVLTQERLAAALPRPAPWTVVLLTAARGPAVAPGAAVPDDLAYVIYTSGSTGRPKGVMATHRAIVNRLLWMNRELPLGETDRVLQKTPYGFDASIWEVFCPLLAGAALVLARPGGHRDSAYLARTVAEEGITTLQLVPSQLGPFLDEPATAECAALTRLFCGGEELPAALADRFHERFRAGLCNLYGPTEAAIDATFWVCRHGDGPRVPIGRPLANVEVHLLNARLMPAPAGVPGELFLGGAGLARGYLRRPEQTAERFVPHPFPAEPGARLYRTGDLARRRADGAIEYLGRVDRQVKIRGVRIELSEIEACLAALPGVRQAVVQAVPEAPAEKGAMRLVAWVVSGDEPGGRAPQVAELRRGLRERLPAAMVPAAFVPLRALPLTANGKLDWRALPAPGDGRPEPDAEFIAPRTPTEEVLADVWIEVLEVDRVGVRDNFFDLGGHSLRATQLVSRLRRLFQVELPLRDLFREPTVAALARHVDDLLRGAAGAVAPPVLPVPRTAPLPLSFAQQRLWFLHQVQPDSPFYNLPMALRFTGGLDVAALARTLAEVVRRHEALRTTFRLGDDEEPVQEIGPPAPVALPVVDLGALPAGAGLEETGRLIAAEAARPFDLGTGPLLRALLLARGEGENFGVLTMHHIASDGWSTAVLVREVGALYAAFAAGAPSPLPELPIQYADFAHWQRSWLRGEVIEAQIAYWRERLAGAPPVLELPADRPRPAAQSFRGATESRLLPEGLGEELRALARRRGATLFIALVAAGQVLLRWWTGQEDLVVGTDVANRNRGETEGLIGFFINQLALRSDLGGDPTFEEALDRVREVTLGAYAHEDLPFDKLVTALNPEHNRRHSPLFQVKINLHNIPTPELELPGLALRPVAIPRDTAQFDLILNFVAEPPRLLASADYATDLFEARTLARLLAHLETLLATVAARPGVRLGELCAMLSAADRELRLAERQERRQARGHSLRKVRREALSVAAGDGDAA